MEVQPSSQISNNENNSSNHYDSNKVHARTSKLNAMVDDLGNNLKEASLKVMKIQKWMVQHEKFMKKQMRNKNRSQSRARTSSSSTDSDSSTSSTHS